MNAVPLPSFWTTIGKGFVLFFKSYLPLFPIVLLITLIDYFIQNRMPTQVVNAQGQFDLQAFLALLLLLSISMFVVGAIISGMQAIYEKKDFDYVALLKRGLQCFLPMWLFT